MRLAWSAFPPSTGGPRGGSADAGRGRDTRHIPTTSLSLLCLALLWAVPFRSITAQEPAAPGSRYALIITGISGDEAHYRKFWTAASHLATALTEVYGYDRDRVWILFEEVDESKAVVRAQSRLPAIAQAFADLRARLTPADDLFVILIGHTDFDGRHAKFNIKGRDLTDAKLGELVGTLPPCRMCIAVTTANSGYFLRHLSKKGRVVITATKVGKEVCETVFPYRFLRALSDRAADADKDGKLTVAEMFTYAVANVEKFYKEKNLIQTEHALLDDNGDKMGSRKLEKEGRDGSLAREFCFEVVTEF